MARAFVPGSQAFGRSSPIAAPMSHRPASKARSRANPSPRALRIGKMRREMGERGRPKRRQPQMRAICSGGSRGVQVSTGAGFDATQYANRGQCRQQVWSDGGDRGTGGASGKGAGVRRHACTTTIGTTSLPAARALTLRKSKDASAPTAMRSDSLLESVGGLEICSTRSFPYP